MPAPTTRLHRTAAGGAVAVLATALVASTAVPATAAPTLARATRAAQSTSTQAPPTQAPPTQPPPTQPPPTQVLPGNAPLSPLATARPAGLEEAQRQFTARTPVHLREQRLTWGPCPDTAAPADLLPALECAAVRAPRDWNSPGDGQEVTVAISRLRSDGPRPARTVLTNPGGPGGPGLFMPLILAGRPALAGTSEVVGVDVRGTGASTNVTCGLDDADLHLPDARDRSPQALAHTARVMRQVARACSSTSPLAPFVNTEQTVADLDLVRAVLGRDQVDWVGYSGGTWLGAQYATYFPARVGRFVLDSSVDVAAPFQQVFAEDQPLGFHRRFTRDFQPWAAQHHARFRLGRTPQEVNASYERLRADLVARPLELPLVGRVDGTTLDGMVAQSMYSKTAFEDLATTMRLLRLISDLLPMQEKGELLRLQAQAGPAVRDLLPRRGTMTSPLPRQGTLDQAADAQAATFLTITCNDTAWSRGQRFWNALGQRQGERYPLVGWSTTQQPCGYWRRPPLSLPKPDGRDLPPLLIVQSEHDPATPVEGARRAHEALGTSRLVLVEGEGDHALYASIGNPCLDELVDRFLATGQAPAGDVTCAGTGLPQPGRMQAKSTRQDLRELLVG
ncbi:TAP-like protein [Kineococcus xinjiangensis]|uniref:TAP-like protein n=1 Tax=Kineococcus xinjiangensis TaxID=512762 RepID=A0A2S6IWG4_9ACTN|nr:alpha/beta hydrolase [Kineococcus xinjiangensis]PPK98626.1 TAP-like protein [Kineococcus xinjiangensis]